MRLARASAECALHSLTAEPLGMQRRIDVARRLAQGRIKEVLHLRLGPMEENLAPRPSLGIRQVETRKERLHRLFRRRAQRVLRDESEPVGVACDMFKTGAQVRQPVVGVLGLMDR